MRAFFREKIFYSKSTDLGDEILDLIERDRAKNSLIIIDENVARYHKSLLNMKHRVAMVDVVEFSEEDKDYQFIPKYVDRYQKCLDKNGLVVVVGGGAIIDFIGFLTGILYRGIRYISVPTSLMAMADSAYGGKTAVNLYAKNQLGLYHFPESVYLNPTFLFSLPYQHLISGLVEIFKISFFSKRVEGILESLDFEKLAENPLQLERALITAAKLKFRLLQIDPFEQSQAAFFLYGHCFSNAFEAYCWENLDTFIPHGYSVALGMLLSAWIAERVDNRYVFIVDNHLKSLSRILDLSSLVDQYTPSSLDLFCEYMRRDKYCVGKNVKIPALFLNKGYTSISLDYIKSTYAEWRVYILEKCLKVENLRIDRGKKICNVQ